MTIQNNANVIGNQTDMMNVACNCQSYDPDQANMVSAVGAPESKSCSNCNNMSNNACQAGVYDSVLASIDDTSSFISQESQNQME